MIPSKYQEAIFEEISSGSGGLIIRAVAGSGKTTMLVETSSRISGTALMCAFNKHIESELSTRMKGSVATKTIHSIGMNALYKHIGNLSVEKDKYMDICHNVSFDMAQVARLKRDSLEKDAIVTPAKTKRLLHSLARMAMMTLADTDSHEELKAMASLYSIKVPECQEEHFFSAVPKVIDLGERGTRDGIISFEDMIYYPAKKNLPCKEHLWVMVDEAQDLSAAQLVIVKNCLKSRGRMIAVGDELQSLYGFTGADPWSFDNIRRSVSKELPLSICYRCSRSIIDLASNIVPEIEPRNDAPDGSVQDIEMEQMHEIVSGGDMILCRTNAPLVSVLIDLISRGKKAFMRGNDLMITFMDMVDNVVNEPGYSWNSFLPTLMYLRDEMKVNLIMDGEEGAAAILFDMYDAVAECYKKLGCGNAEELKAKIKSLFRETPESIVCSSIHRGKGLESDNVFIIKPNSMRLMWKEQKEWQRFQEQCCEYVAITRAKTNLYMVLDEDDPKPYKIGGRMNLPPREVE